MRCIAWSFIKFEAVRLEDVGNERLEWDVLYQE